MKAIVLSSYFKKIEKAIEKRHRWVVRRRLSLGFLSFGKISIWADVDVSKDSNLLSSELIQNVFGGTQCETSGQFHANDHHIDSHPEGELPLIYDADSSQHFALIDVKAGKTLVINGPSGTGKSQTITSVIATAMAEGKKVLFVVEKLAKYLTASGVEESAHLKGTLSEDCSLSNSFLSSPLICSLSFSTACIVLSSSHLMLKGTI
jgi:hypothetical protein